MPMNEISKFFYMQRFTVLSMKQIVTYCVISFLFPFFLRGLCQSIESESFWDFVGYSLFYIFIVLSAFDHIIEQRSHENSFRRMLIVLSIIQDIIARFKERIDGKDKIKWSDFPTKVAVQLNDTHPTLAIPELMRLLMDTEGLGWDEAWSVTNRCFLLVELYRCTFVSRAMFFVSFPMAMWLVDLTMFILPVQ